MKNKTFNEKCYELLKTIPKGKIVTYSILAHALGCRAYRAVGNAMNKNPYNTEEVPCHRVVNSSGKLGGYAWRPEIKIKKLQDEGIKIKINKNKLEDSKIENFNEILYEFKLK